MLRDKGEGGKGCAEDETYDEELLWDPYHVVRPGIVDDAKATENRIKTLTFMNMMTDR